MITRVTPEVVTKETPPQVIAKEKPAVAMKQMPEVITKPMPPVVKKQIAEVVTKPVPSVVKKQVAEVITKPPPHKAPARQATHARDDRERLARRSAEPAVQKAFLPRGPSKVEKNLLLRVRIDGIPRTCAEAGLSKLNNCSAPYHC